jgi:hypothetical protein
MVIGDARVSALDDEQLLDAVQRALRELVLPHLEGCGADEFLISQVRSCLSIVGFVARGLCERQTARAATDAELGYLFDTLEHGSAWSAPAPLATGRFLAGGGHGAGDGERAARVKALLRARLEIELRTRLGTSAEAAREEAPPGSA